MNRRRIVLNALTTIGQTLGSAAVLFFLYRFLIRAVGVERLGIWSLVLATTSVVWLANQGFSTSLVKFVAKYAAHEQDNDVALLIQTAVLSIALGLAIISTAFYPGARSILRLVLPPKTFPEACSILPFALVSLWLTVVESILQAALAGHQLIAECNYLEMGGSLSYLSLAFALVPRHGLIGLALAQAFQAGVIVAITWLLLRRQVASLPFIPRRWSSRHFRELAAYGLHFQLITTSQALREPVTKALITKFGGLAFTGFYDLAARAVMTVREVLAQANQILIPAVSHLQERDPDSIPRIYCESYRLVFFLAVPAFACLTIASPLISRVWIGRYESAFVAFVAILSVGWLVNVLANPAYVIDLGTGALRWVSVGCAATAVLNAALGFLAGRYAAPFGFGAVAIVSSMAVSLVVGYVIVVVAYHRESRTPFAQLLPGESTPILFASLACAALFLFGVAALIRSATSLRLVAFATFALLAAILIPMWRHPMRERVLRWAFTRVPV